MTVSVVKSFEKFNYLLRPSKQVERKMIIEALQRLAALNTGYDLADYTYVGFGSVYYADFVLFHKHLHIKEMICVEKSDIEKRMAFNKPFDFIQLKMCAFSDVVTTLDRGKKHFVWLDYDYSLDEDILGDLHNLLHLLAPGSIIMVTVDAEQRIDPGKLDEAAEAGSFLPDDLREEMYCEQFKQMFGPYLAREIEPKDISRSSLPTLLRNVITSRIEDGLSEDGKEYLQLFNFVYADNAQMLTVGGIVGSPAQIRNIRTSRILEVDFITDGPDPIRISVPHLTLKEKQWLDSESLTKKKDLPFELDARHLENYRRFYKYYPSYFEAVT